MMMMFSGATSKRSSQLLHPGLRLATSQHTGATVSMRSLCTLQRLNMLALQQPLHQRRLMLSHSDAAGLTYTPTRSFFGRKKTEEKKEEAAEASTEEAKDKDAAAAEDQEPKEEAAKEEPAAAEGEAEATKEDASAKATDKNKKSEGASGSEDAASSEEEGLSAKDVQRIKKLFNEQEAEIKGLKKRIKQLEEESKRKDNETKLARIEFTKQVRENELTVQRYRKMIEDEKEFAITKFAKDLLEVRDAVRMALEHTDVEAVKNEEELQLVKDKFIATMEGQQMTADVMDKVLERFKVVQYDPKGQKFDPQLHDAVFTVPQSEQDNDTVEIVISTGWKIGDRILRAAKVGIVKKS